MKYRHKFYYFFSQGFTLLELILYIATLVIMMSALIPFAWNVIEGGAKSATEREVYSQGRYVSERIKYEIRNATGIISVSPTQIFLSTANPATNPTIIASNSGSITIQQGTGNPIALNSQNTTVQSLHFYNYSTQNSSSENIRFVFTISANFQGAGSRQEYQGATTIDGDAEVRGSNNILANGSFDTSGAGWLGPWAWNVFSGTPNPPPLAVGSYSQDTTTQMNGCCSFTATVTTNNPSSDWYLQLLQPNIFLAAGRAYTLTFWAKASIGRAISASVQQDYAPYGLYAHNTFTLTTTWQQFTLPFTQSATDANVMVNFNLAASTGQVWLDNVSLN